MSDLQWIPFDELQKIEGGFSTLFADYINDFQKVKRYYASDFHSMSTIAAHIEKIHGQARHRALLVEVLEEQNRAFGSSSLTHDNIRKLADENTFAIVTGQQVGILSGPLYTIYKTITAVKLARQLSENYPQYAFVPVFWLEGEDHDFEEVSKINLLNQEHHPITIEYLLKGKRLQKISALWGN